MKKAFWLPALAWAGGAVGFFLRRWEWSAAYDPTTKLMTVQLPGILLTLLMAALTLVFCLGCRGMGRRQAQDWFYDPASGYAAAALSGALVLAIAGGLGLYQYRATGERNVTALVSAVLLVVGGLAAVAAVKGIYRGLWSEKTPVLLMGLPFATVVWLVCVYQRHARQPEIQLFVWQVLAGAAVVLAMYSQVDLALDKGRAGSACVIGLLAITLTPAVLADGVGLMFGLVWLGSAVWLTAQSHMLLSAAFDPDRPERMCPPEETEQPEQDNDLEDTNDG